MIDLLFGFWVGWLWIGMIVGGCLVVLFLRVWGCFDCWLVGVVYWCDCSQKFECVFGFGFVVVVASFGFDG